VDGVWGVLLFRLILEGRYLVARPQAR
jgi:hypothetical protein